VEGYLSSNTHAQRLRLMVEHRRKRISGSANFAREACGFVSASFGYAEGRGAIRYRSKARKIPVALDGLIL